MTRLGSTSRATPQTYIGSTWFFSYWKDWKIKNFTKIIAILFKPFSGSFSLQSHFKVKTYTGLGSTGLPGLPGYNGWNPLANDKKKLWEKKCEPGPSKVPKKLSCWNFERKSQTVRKSCKHARLAHLDQMFRNQVAQELLVTVSFRHE